MQYPALQQAVVPAIGAQALWHSASVWQGPGQPPPELDDALPLDDALDDEVPDEEEEVAAPLEADDEAPPEPPGGTATMPPEHAAASTQRSRTTAAGRRCEASAGVVMDAW